MIKFGFRILCVANYVLLAAVKPFNSFKLRLHILHATSDNYDIPEIIFAENLIHQQPQTVLFMIVNGNTNYAVFR